MMIDIYQDVHQNPVMMVENCNIAPRTGSAHRFSAPSMEQTSLGREQGHMEYHTAGTESLGFWRRALRALDSFAEHLDYREGDLLAERISQLEREVDALKSKSS